MTRQLNQIIAIEKGVKDRVHAEVTALFRDVQKPDLINGLAKTYEPLKEEDAKLPPETKRVQVIVSESLARIATLWGDLFDIAAAREYGNTLAKADIIVDGKAFLTGVPATYLIYLEKKLEEARDVIAKCVTLDPAHDWKSDAGTGTYRTDPIRTHRTEKSQEPHVLVQPTKEHPAQVAMITKDRIAGYWATVHISGALPEMRKKELAARVEKLSRAVKAAREQANATPAETQNIGPVITDYLFK